MRYQPFHTSAVQDAALDALIAAARDGVCILDLDGCLFDTRARQIHIVRAFAEATGRPVLHRIAPEHFAGRDKGQTLVNAGLPAHEREAVMEAFAPYWLERFFAPDAPLLDAVMPGAVRFVRELADAGGRLVYLTGRHAPMRSATLRALDWFGFPPGELITKPTFEEPDHVYKERVLAGLVDVTVGLDNEPANVNALADRFPDATIAWVRTDHSDLPIVPYGHLLQVHGFLREGDIA